MITNNKITIPTMSKDRCSFCNQIRIKYCSHPQVICHKCVRDAPVELVLRMMDPSYHEAIASKSIMTLNELEVTWNNSYPSFWCTTNTDGLFKRCGVSTTG